MLKKEHLVRNLILIILLLLTIYLVLGEFIIGPLNKQETQIKDEEKLLKANAFCKDVTTSVYKEKVYTCKNGNDYQFFDSKNKLIGNETNLSQKFPEKLLVNYPKMKDGKITLSYVDHKSVWVITKGNKQLVFDYHNNKLIYNSKDV